MFSISYVLPTLQSQLHNNDDVWRKHDFEWCVGRCFVIHSIKPRTVPVVFVVEGYFDELCDPGCPRFFFKKSRQTRAVCNLALSY